MHKTRVLCKDHIEVILRIYILPNMRVRVTLLLDKEKTKWVAIYIYPNTPLTSIYYSNINDHIVL
jgi:hypothetical protein